MSTRQTNKPYHLILLQAIILITACGSNNIDSKADADGNSAPTKFTVDANSKVLGELPFSDRQDFIEANRGLIASDPNLTVKGPDGDLIWNQSVYKFIKGKAPYSVNPSLWRQAKLNNIHGLFKVVDGVYQIRGYDFANMTIIEGKTGWIIVDPLTSKETAARAISFAQKNMPKKKPIVAIIFTHSHVDHFGGVLGIISAQKAAKNRVKIIAPEGFMTESTSENIMAGPTMARRSGYMYGKNLPRKIRGNVGSGLGKGPAYGNFGIIRPTHVMKKS